jgi:ribosome-binding protein aMBF1 (putative translation factor)
MAGLYLHCGLCGRKQADGLLSRGFWGHVVVTDGAALSACPTCKEQYSDWEQRLQAEQNGPSQVYGGTYRWS